LKEHVDLVRNKLARLEQRLYETEEGVV